MNSTKVVSQLQVSSSILIVYLKVTSKIKLKWIFFPKIQIRLRLQAPA